jgi:hypothetical protein
MCDKEQLLGYLYGELQASDREVFDRHLTSCAACRKEVDALRGTRAQLALWAPPEPDLDFQIVRGAKPAAPAAASWWRFSPAWGLAAAALLVIAVSAAIANVEVRFESGGIAVRTGWGHTLEPATTEASAAIAADVLQRVDARVKELEGQLAARYNTSGLASPVAGPGRMSDAELLRIVRRLVAESEERQQGVLARQIVQVNRDVETARRADIDRLLIGIRQIQGTAAETFQRQRAIEDHLVRVGLQR